MLNEPFVNPTVPLVALALAILLLIDNTRRERARGTTDPIFRHLIVLLFSFTCNGALGSAILYVYLFRARPGLSLLDRIDAIHIYWPLYLLTALLTSWAALRPSRPFRRVAWGAIGGVTGASVSYLVLWLQLRLSSNLVVKIMLLQLSAYHFWVSRELAGAIVISLACGALTGLVAHGMMRGPIPRVWPTAARVGTVAAFLGVVVFILIRPIPDRIAVSLSSWREISLVYLDAVSATGFVDLPQFGSAWIEILQWSNEFRLDVKMEFDKPPSQWTMPPWRPPRLEISRLELSNRDRETIGKETVDTRRTRIYQGFFPAQHLRVVTPHRSCRILSDSPRAKGINVELRLPTSRRIAFATLQHGRMAPQLWFPDSDLNRRPETIVVYTRDFEETPISLISSGNGKYNLLCHSASAHEAPSLGLPEGRELAAEIEKAFKPGRSPNIGTWLHPGFLLTAEGPPGKHDITIVSTGATVLMEGATFRFGSPLGSRVRDIEVRAPTGTLRIGTTSYPLTPTDELSIGGNNMVIGHREDGQLTIGGTSSAVSHNGVVLTRRVWNLIPDSVTDLIVKIGLAIFTFYLGRYYGRRQGQQPTP